MVRATQKSLKLFSYAVALIAGAVLVMFGINARHDSGTVADTSLHSLTADTAEAAHGGDTPGDFINRGGDDDDGGGGDGGGG